MAEKYENESFKTTLMGGFDKDDVLEKFQTLKGDAEKTKNELLNEIKERDKKIAELEQKLKEKQEENETLQKNIKEKYQSYIDNYDTIGKLVYDSKVRADDLLAETKKRCDAKVIQTRKECSRMIEEARRREEEAVSIYEGQIQRKAEEAQKYLDEQLKKGRENYQIIRRETTRMVQAMDTLQKGFLESYKKVHSVKDTVAVSSEELENFFAQLASKPIDYTAPCKEKEPEQAREKTKEKTKEKTVEYSSPKEEYFDEGGVPDDELNSICQELEGDTDDQFFYRLLSDVEMPEKMTAENTEAADETENPTETEEASETSES